MRAYALSDVAEARRRVDKSYVQFLNAGTMSAGLYELPSGAEDPQTPHAEDEIYAVLDGRAHITVAGETRPVHRGDIVFVAAGVEHAFHDIEEDLSVLVIFAPEHQLPGD
ncbi:MAG: cupin domain-containing protein [Hyphomicrobiales bacterium]|nr:cupin domain-containing protein [Hyphomicrobiales bacterium]